jgi:two-component system, OmpR family, phosphate regulon sensor histidine kinase PhoR
MNKSLRKITIVFFLIALLPVSFIVYELSSLNSNEKIIRDIYENQLDAILFSVNQYADDVISSWANKIDVAMTEIKPGEIDSLKIGDINSISALYFSDLNQTIHLNSFPGYQNESFDFIPVLNQLEKKHADRINKLESYLQAGFRKMEPLDTVLFHRFIPVLFILDQQVKPYRVAIMLLDIPAFIQNNLGPKMQAIAQDKFEIAVLKEGDSNLIYSTANLVANPSSEDNEIKKQGFSKRLWLLPGYYLAISLQNATINDLVEDRMKTSWIILVLLLVILLGGIAFLYRNIRNEIRLSQAKTEFVSNVSHEIRTPLALISMYAETLEMGRVSEEKKKEYYSIISGETVRLSGIVNRILNFSKMDANKKEYSMRLEDLNELCERVLKAYGHHLERNAFKLDFIPDDNIPLIEADDEAISEAIINLLDNAMKYSDKIKHVIVSTGSDSGSVYVAVKDMGIGIPKAYQKEIFEQFYRAPMGNVHNTKGSGLGLSLVKKTMQAHKGDVVVESTLDKGSTFRLLFPIIPGKV